MRVKKTHEARNKTRWALFFLPPSLALFYSHPDALQPPFSLSNLPSRSPTPLLALQPPFSLFNPPPPLPYPSFFFHPFKFTKTSQPPLHSTPSPPPRNSFQKQKKMVSKTLLGAGAVLHVGEKLVSPNGKCEAVLQDDGNFVVYVDKKDIWARCV